ncbi:hypothetical protein MVLG_00642 [Microbotryum lychnidis-dioicae p1A1 Lamole]|uniref:Nitrate/nitrite transporter n=1 Tax=Microbotryum lychnidis-dioicae (strain p1A1 Lamole / MvSl-1064) TaxID=683840 RepID=U5GZP4_USTV1|nr:hypothetical protein MVLG_00642 [Microbotryum lychnidis-dioicae p1A1 Lamole]|eukprot:KDE09326.1 hypothetical protein MVLG_00642 [Microbotryum lychnidis-dioicae p1A1 Lamole]
MSTIVREKEVSSSASSAHFDSQGVVEAAKGVNSNNATLNYNEPPSFRIASLWEKPVVNPLNGKSQTLPMFNLANPYTRNFHLSWLGFFVAFLSWFAFPPLIPEAIKTDLKLTTAQIGNSNITALASTLGVRLIMGPFVDRFGPRKVMAALLLLGAIPSGLAGTITDYKGLYIIRFFIGILGATFVPCQAWTTAMFDKNVVGTANAFTGGWGNLGGGVTFVVQVALFQALLNDGLSSHSAWRAAFAIVPCPILIFVAILCLVFGTDCPAGKWSERHTMPASSIAMSRGHLTTLDASQRRIAEQKMSDKEAAKVTVQEAVDDDVAEQLHDIDVAVAEKPSIAGTLKIATTPYTWLPSIMYMTTFGFELAVDANLANVLFAVHKSPSFGQLKAGYYASIFGFLNVWTRPLGGILGDMIGKRWGPQGKKYATLTCGFLQGVVSLAYGLHTLHAFTHGNKKGPSLGFQIGLIVVMAIFNEMANGLNFSLVPHCVPYSNGIITGIVGAAGNLGGIIYALMFRFHPQQGYAAAWWISGIFAMVVNLVVIAIPPPKH